MANNIEEIALLKHRTGNASELPYALNDSEIGFSNDTLELFIGASMNPKMLQRMNDKVYPFGNLRILTELDLESLAENLKVLNYIYKGNTPLPTLFPIILRGSTINPVLTSDSVITINDKSVSFLSGDDLENIVSKFNNAHIDYTNAYNLGNTIAIVSTDNDLKIIQERGNFLQDLGLAESGETEIGQSAKDLTQCTLQTVLDNYLSVKYFNVKGDGETDDTINLNNALLATYSVSDAPVYLRCLYMPAGTYLISDGIAFPENTRLIGEGKGRTVIKSASTTNYMFGLLDTNKTPFTSESYDSTIAPKNITIENITFDGSDSTSSILGSLDGGEDITFRNCEFIANSFTQIVGIYDNNTHITFDNCDFKSGKNGIISIGDKTTHLSIINCHFSNIEGAAIDLSNKSNQAFIHNCCFINCGSDDNYAIFNGYNADYTSIQNCQFGDTIGFDKTIKPYYNQSETLKTDILDPSNANEDMVYKFKNPQPVWGYVEDLRNNKGEYIVRAFYDADNNVVNYLYVKAGTDLSDKVEVFTSDKFKEMQIAGGQYASLILGESDTAKFNVWQSDVNYIKDEYVVYNEAVYVCQQNHVSVSSGDLANTTLWVKVVNFDDLYVKLGKKLDLNGYPITNKAGGDIVFETNDDGVISVNDENYTTKIDDKNNALANVGYVKQNVASKVIKKYIDMSEMITSESWNIINLGLIDSASYSNNVYVKNVNISVEHIFNEVDYNSILDWESGEIYYAGDAVKNGNYYYICRETNADSSFINSKWERIELTDKSPKTIELSALKSSGSEIIIPSGQVNLYETEKQFPVISTIRNDKGQTYQFTYGRYENMADASFTLSFLDEDGNLATMLQPAGKLFIMIELVLG